MHYKMRDQIRFKIGKEEKNIQEKWIEIQEGTEHIQMMIEMPEEFQYMAFLFLEDPKKEIRFHFGKRHLLSCKSAFCRKVYDRNI